MLHDATLKIGLRSQVDSDVGKVDSLARGERLQPLGQLLVTLADPGIIGQFGVEGPDGRLRAILAKDELQYDVFGADQGHPPQFAGKCDDGLLRHIHAHQFLRNTVQAV